MKLEPIPGNHALRELTAMQGSPHVMSRSTWVILLAAYGMIALLIPLLGYALPPCLGTAEGRISAECIAHWQSEMPVVPQRFVDVLGVPASGIVSFLALAGATLLVDLTRRAGKWTFATQSPTVADE